VRVDPRALSPLAAIMYERKGDQLLPFPRFLGRVGRSLLLALGIALSALLIGTLGYHFIARLPWIDAELNAAMILTGMGPVDPMITTAAKIFASVYALFSGVVFLTSLGLVLSPVFHRVVHRFHLDEDGSKSDRSDKASNRRGASDSKSRNR
jgi:hypothetical protein